MDKELRTALSSMIERFGFDSVSQTLRELETDQVKQKTRRADPPKRAPNNGSGNKRRVSAVEYVRTMDIPAEQSRSSRPRGGGVRATNVPADGGGRAELL